MCPEEEGGGNAQIALRNEHARLDRVERFNMAAALSGGGGGRAEKFACVIPPRHETVAN